MTKTYVKIGNQKLDASQVELPSREFRDAWVSDGNTITVDLAKKNEILSEKVNEERRRRLGIGSVITVNGYGDIPVQGRDEDQITILALELSAKSMKEAGVTTASIPFRDRDNGSHMLTPDQCLELMSKAKQHAQAIYVASWTLKDMAEIPEDHKDDKWWP